MNFDIALFLGQDGLINGAIYGLLAIGLVLVFSVTRVIFISQGDLVAYSALSMASLGAAKIPGTFWLLIALSCLVLCVEIVRWRRGEQLDWGLTFTWTIFFPLCAALLLFIFPSESLTHHIISTLAIVIPLGPLLYRLAFRPIQAASVLFLLITAVTLHGVMVGLGLIFFGAEGWRIPAFTEMSFMLGNVNIKGQSLIIVFVTIVLVSLLFLFFEKFYLGKVLRATAVNRTGARLVGIPVELCGDLSFAMAALIATVSGILIAPVQTIYYDTGFLIGLKGFVAAIIGGLASFPLAFIGALMVGQLEAFSSYWASAYKEVIVFTLIIPILFWRSLGSRHVEEEE
jgi:branched-chain amino acid transport system permease protein